MHLAKCTCQCNFLNTLPVEIDKYHLHTRNGWNGASIGCSLFVSLHLIWHLFFPSVAAKQNLFAQKMLIFTYQIVNGYLWFYVCIDLLDDSKRKERHTEIVELWINWLAASHSYIYIKCGHKYVAFATQTYWLDRHPLLFNLRVCTGSYTRGHAHKFNIRYKYTIKLRIKCVSVQRNSHRHRD